MSRAPRIARDDLIRALRSLGVHLVRVRGHKVLKHADGRITVVPVHAAKVIGPGLLNKILRDCSLTCAELEQRLT